MIIRNGLAFEGNGFRKKDIYIADGHFAAIADDSVNTDAEGMYVIPGLIDIHLHGAAGADMCDGTYEALDTIAEYQAANGITAICPATMTLDEGTLLKVMHNYAGWRASFDYSGNESFPAGVYMEGPFISEQKRGAQNDSYCRLPDYNLFERLCEASERNIKVVTVAPELAGSEVFIKEASAFARVSLAHSTADYDTAIQAFNMGARQVTHLYNAMNPVAGREPGIPCAVSDREYVMAELICDGEHVHPAQIRNTFRMLGEDRIIFISDSMRACGMPDGIYTLGGQNVIVEGGRACLEKDGSHAGSVSNLAMCLKKAVREIGIPLVSAVKAVTVNPAKAIGIYDSRGSLDTGKVADAVILDRDMNVVNVILRGKLL